MTLRLLASILKMPFLFFVSAASATAMLVRVKKAQCRAALSGT
jgi:hypothetical protein